MRNKKTILLFFILLTTALSIFLSINSTADDGQCKDCDDIAGETIPGNAKNCKIRPLKFTGDILDEIECGTPVTITIVDGSSPFTWEVSGNGYTLTEINERQYSLSCNTGCTCGNENGQAGAVATVTVTDDCGETDSIVIRNTSGRWDNPTLLCAAMDEIGGNQSILGAVIPGKYRYCLRYDSYGCGSCNGRVSCSNECAAMILSGNYGFDEHLAMTSCWYINSDTTSGILAGCTSAEGGTCIGFWNGVSCYNTLTNCGLIRYEWKCP